jgi:hypothetical protein
MVITIARCISVALLVSLIAATQPASKPALGPPTSLSSGLIEFNAPPEPWATPEEKPNADGVVYTTKDRLGQMQVQVLPKDASVTQNAAVAIMKDLREKRAKGGVTVVMPATVEKDSRFAIKIHEKYKIEKKTVDALHLYRNVGPRAVMSVISSLAEDAGADAAILKTGEDVLLSAKFNKAAMK